MVSRSSRHKNNLFMWERLIKCTRTLAGWCRACLVIVVLCCLAPATFAETADNTGIRGVVKAVNEALLTVDIKANISNLPVRAGESFSEGDVLVQFDCTAEKAESAAMQAVYRAAQARYENSVEMKSYDAIGAFDVNLAKAEMDEAKARSSVAEARTRQCRITAPYAGRVAELAVNQYEMPAPDTPLMKIVGTSSLELRLIVPSAWLNWLQRGAQFQFQVDETGKNHVAIVNSIGAEVDAVSKTVPIIASFQSLPATVLPGMSGTARFIQAKLAQAN